MNALSGDGRTGRIGAKMERRMSDSRFIQDGHDKQLSHLIEECGEVLAAAGKIQRWGWLSVNPLLPEDQQETNISWLYREMADLQDSITRLKATIENNFPAALSATGEQMTENDEEFLGRMVKQFSLYVHGIRGQDADRLLALARRGLTAREEIEKTRAWLADVDVASLPNDFPLDEIARIRMQTLRERTLEGLALIGKAEDAWNEAIEEAAKVAGKMYRRGQIGEDIAAAIRALKRTDEAAEAAALHAAYKRGKVDGLREAADSLLPQDGSGLQPHSAMRFLYDEFRARAAALEQETRTV